MHQHTHQHAFPPTLHQSLTILCAPMATQDNKFNTHLPRGSTRPSFAPVTAFHRATQKSFRSTKRGKWGAMHVCIAWKIYYHEQLKTKQQKPNSLCRDLTPEYPATSRHNSMQHKESDQSSCIQPNLDSPRGPLGKTAKNVRDMNTSYPSDLNTPSPCHIRTTKREKLEQNLQPEKEKHGCQQTDTAKDLPHRDTSWDLTMTPELRGRHSGSHGRKRQFECDGFIQVKRVKQEVTDDQFDSSKTLHTDPSRTHPSSHTVQVQQISDLHPNSRFNVTRIPGGLISYPAAEVHPYQAASWDAMWDVQQRMNFYSGQNVLKDYSLNTCKAIRIPLVVQRQKEAFHGFFAPPLYLPLALRQQDLRGREFLQPRYDNCNLHRCRYQLSHPGFLATPYLGP